MKVKATLALRIALPTTLAFVACLGLAGVLVHTASQRAAEDAVWTQLTLIAGAMEKSISDWTSERRNEMRMLAQRSHFTLALLEKNLDGPAHKAARELLAAHNAEAPAYEIMLMVDAKGQIHCSSDPPRSRNASIAGRDYFQRAVKGEAVVSQVIRSQGSGRPCFAVAVPIGRSPGVIGVLIGVLGMESFTKRFVEGVKIGPSGYLFVTDRAGMIASHPDSSLILAKSLSDLPFGAQVREEKNGRLTYDWTDGRIVAVFRTDPLYGWSVIARASAEEMLRTARRIRDINLLGAVLAILVTFFVVLTVVRSITRPLEALVTAAGEMAAGRLIQANVTLAHIPPSARSASEAGRLFEAMVRMTLGLTELMGQLQRSSDQLSINADQIADAAGQQQRVTTSFRDTTATALAYARQIAGSSHQVTQTVGEVRGIAEESAQLATAGRASLTEMDASIDRLVKVAQTLTSRLSAIDVRAKAIEGIVTTMVKVADRTNLLSLNAAIEAEKAKEHGRGFSVVAREIRRLADQVAGSTLDIEKMVREMGTAVAAGVADTSTFTAEFRASVRTVWSVRDRLSEIIERIQNLAPRFEIVDDAVRGQAEGARRIETSLGVLEETATQAAKAVEQLHAVTEELHQSARSLQEHVASCEV